MLFSSLTSVGRCFRRSIILSAAWGLLLGCSPPSAKEDAEESTDSTTEDVDPEPNVSLGHGETGDDVALPPVGGHTAGGYGGAGSAICLSFVSWGAVAPGGAVPGESGMDAIVSWLNESSTASGVHYQDKPEITPEFMQQFDVVLLQDLSDWDISDEEIDTFKEWVRDGGGVIALSGYTTNVSQVMATNRLLSFSGMNFVSIAEAGDTSTSLGVCSYCLGSTDVQTGWNPEHPIAEGIEAVGAFQGRSIQGDGAIVAEEDGKILAMTTEEEDGRVFLFHDDWVSYHERWSQDAPGECIENDQCFQMSPATTYQVPRFWYNAFDWAVGGRDCFRVDDVELTD